MNLESLISQLITGLGEDINREGLKKTPERSIKAWKKICSGYDQRVEEVITTFDAENFDEMIIVRDIEFYSTCEHHMLPFFGKVTVGYIPDKKILGLSKVPRIVEVFSRRLQNQERLTMQIAESIHKVLKPKGVGVIISAKHMCMMARGVEKQSPFVETSSLRGSFKTDQRTRGEFLRLAGK